MTRSKSMKSVALMSVTAAATLLLIQACGGSAQAQANDADPVEGAWGAAVAVRDCTTNAVLFVGRSQAMAQRGGIWSQTDASPPTTRGVGFGTWTRDATAQNYTTRFRFMRCNADGSFAGTVRVTRVFTLSADGNTQTSTNTSQTLDAAGTVLQSGCGSDVSTRVL